MKLACKVFRIFTKKAPGIGLLNICGLGAKWARQNLPVQSVKGTWLKALSTCLATESWNSSFESELFYSRWSFCSTACSWNVPEYDTVVLQIRSFKDLIGNFYSPLVMIHFNSHFNWQLAIRWVISTSSVNLHIFSSFLVVKISKTLLNQVFCNSFPFKEAFKSYFLINFL